MAIKYHRVCDLERGVFPSVILGIMCRPEGRRGVSAAIYFRIMCVLCGESGYICARHMRIRRCLKHILTGSTKMWSPKLWMNQRGVHESVGLRARETKARGARCGMKKLSGANVGLEVLVQMWSPKFWCKCGALSFGANVEP